MTQLRMRLDSYGTAEAAVGGTGTAMQQRAGGTHGSMDRPWVASAQLSSRASSTERSSTTSAKFCDSWLPVRAIAEARLVFRDCSSEFSGRSIPQQDLVHRRSQSLALAKFESWLNRGLA